MKVEVRKLLGSRQTEERLRGIRLMAADPTLTDVPLLAKLTRDRSQIVAARAIRLLGERQAYETVPKLIELFLWLHESPVERDSGCVIRTEIVTALGALGGRRGLDILRLGLRTVQIESVSGGFEDTAAGLRANSAMALAHVGDHSALTDLAILLYDGKPNVTVPPSEAPYAKASTRVAAARALANLGHPAAEALLAPKLVHTASEVPEVLVECMDALVAVQSDRAIEIIAPLLGHREPYVVAGAATSLAATGKEEVAALLYDAVTVAVRDARQSIVLALGALRHEAGIKYLVDLLGDTDPAIRSAAEQALATYPNEAVQSYLST